MTEKRNDLPDVSFGASSIYDLVDMFESWEKVQELSEQVGGVKAQLIDPQGKFIVGREQLPDFCRLVRSTKLGEHRCIQSYLENCFQGAAEGTVFECHAGLTNVSLPLVVNRRPVGAILGGRVLASGKKADGRRLRALADELGVDPEELAEAAQRLERSDGSALPAFGKLVKPFVDSLASTIFRYSNLIEKTESLIDTAKESEKLLFVDRVTDLLNQRYFGSRLAAEVSRADRYHHPLALILCEVDDFEEKTASYGHLTQDVILREIAELLSKTSRKTEIVCRTGEAKFGIILPEADHERAFKLGERARKAIGVAHFGAQANLDIELTASMGISALFKGISADALVERADKVLEQAKQDGGNKIRISPVPEGTVPKEAPHVYVPKAEKKRRVVVTGLGPITPIGIGKDAFWQACKEGKSGVDKIASFDAADLPTQIAGEVSGFNPEEHINPKDLRRMDRFTQFAVAAARMAVEDARLDLSAVNKDRMGVVTGTAIGGFVFGARQHTVLTQEGFRKLNPFLAIALLFGASSSQVSIDLGLTGPSLTFSTGCNSGADAISHAFDMISRNGMDTVIAGGAEAPLMPTVVAAFSVLRALSTRNAEPAKASRPFDLERDGFVLGEGAGMLVLEDLEHARTRGAHIYAEILGYGTTCDAYHMTRPGPDGGQMARAVALALSNAGVKATDVNYVNAHGSSTPLNDVVETRAIKRVFGDHASRLRVSSTKSMIGHSVGAPGAIELIVTALAIDDGFVPPTINYEHSDPDCDLDYVPNTGRKEDIDLAVSNSFSFGGKNTIIVARKYR